MYKDKEGKYNMLSEGKFTKHDFVGLLLALLYKNGVYKIKETELEEKLLYYYKNDDFNEIFQEINLAKDGNRLNLYDALYRIKHFSNSILYDKFDNDILLLKYSDDMVFQRYEKCLSENGKLKIRQMAEELGKIYRNEQISKTKLNIFRVNPNGFYTLVHGMHAGKLLEFQLITDGDIVRIDYKDTKGIDSYYYKSPYDSQKSVQIKNNKVVYIDLINASYVIKQGLCDGKIRYNHVNTQVLEENELNSIVHIANKQYKGDEFSITKEAPYVRKLILK